MDVGEVRAMVSAVNCVRLMIHRPVPLGQIIHYTLIKIILKKIIKKEKEKIMSVKTKFHQHYKNLTLANRCTETQGKWENDRIKVLGSFLGTTFSGK